MKNHKSSCLITSGVGRTDDQDERPEMIKKQENRQVTDTDTLPKQVPILLGGGPTVSPHVVDEPLVAVMLHPHLSSSPASNPYPSHIRAKAQ